MLHAIVDCKTGQSRVVDDGQTTPVYVAPVPEDISDRQFAQALALNGLITNIEALEWVKVGTVPQTIQAIVDAMTDTAQQFAANMLLGGATTFQRHHPMVEVLGSALGKTSDEIDDIWRLAVTL